MYPQSRWSDTPEASTFWQTKARSASALCPDPRCNLFSKLMLFGGFIFVRRDGKQKIVIVSNPSMYTRHELSTDHYE